MHKSKRKNRELESRQRLKYVVSDFAMSFVAFLLFNVVRFHLLEPGGDIASYIFSTKLLIEELTVPFVMLGLFWLSGYYNQPFGKSRLQEMIATFNSAMIGTALIYLVLLINDQTGERKINYEIILYLLTLLFVFPYVGRLSLTISATRLFRAHRQEYRVMIVGETAQNRMLARRLLEDKSRVSYRIVAFVDIDGIGREGDNCRSWLQDVETFEIKDMEKACVDLGIDQVIIASFERDENRVVEILNVLFPLDIAVKIAPDTLSYVTSAIRLKDIYGDPFVDLTTPALSESSKNVKRMLDVVVPLMLLVILSPILLLIAAMVRKDSQGPAIYRQERIGKKKMPFVIYKFRTMAVDAEKDGPMLAGSGDPRITKIGRILRKYRLDELPQFWNVVKGDMSIVGPRPERKYFIDKIIRRAPYYALVYQVRPGITSWGMVKYGYASTLEQMVARTKYDLLYMSNMSLFVDMKILIYTIRTVVTGKGM